ncbi:hypothetical protein [Spirosoma litoris]
MACSTQILLELICRFTVNVVDDLTMSYDSNLANNGYARIISGL